MRTDYGLGMGTVGLSTVGLNAPAPVYGSFMVDAAATALFDGYLSAEFTIEAAADTVWFTVTLADFAVAATADAWMLGFAAMFGLFDTEATADVRFAWTPYLTPGVAKVGCATPVSSVGGATDPSSAPPCPPYGDPSVVEPGNRGLVEAFL